MLHSNKVSRYLCSNYAYFGTICLDEAHVLLTCKDFRKEMKQVDRLMGCGIPVMFLTATLPPQIFSDFNKHCKIPIEYNGIRGPSDRKEHCYTVFKLGDNENIVQK